jgi:hypothetical protein
VQIVSVLVPASPEACWRAFNSPPFWIAWVPGLRCSRVLAATPDGLPLEVWFEYAGGVSYVLHYSYDLATRVVRWEPREGDVGGVRGFARFELRGTETLVVYALEHDGTRTSIESQLDDPHVLADTFARYLGEHVKTRS